VPSLKRERLLDYSVRSSVNLSQLKSLGMFVHLSLFCFVMLLLQIYFQDYNYNVHVSLKWGVVVVVSRDLF